MLAIGRNYERHAAESARAWGEQVKPPTIFTKAITSLTEPFADIAIDPEVSDKIDWEVELGVVIGKRGVNIKRSEARPFVFGYLVVNDVKSASCAADTSTTLTVKLTRLTPQGDTAKQIAQAMVVASAHPLSSRLD